MQMFYRSADCRDCFLFTEAVKFKYQSYGFKLSWQILGCSFAIKFCSLHVHMTAHCTCLTHVDYRKFVSIPDQIEIWRTCLLNFGTRRKWNYLISVNGLSVQLFVLLYASCFITGWILKRYLRSFKLAQKRYVLSITLLHFSISKGDIVRYIKYSQIWRNCFRFLSDHNKQATFFLSHQTFQRLNFSFKRVIFHNKTFQFANLENLFCISSNRYCNRLATFFFHDIKLCILKKCENTLSWKVLVIGKL